MQSSTNHTRILAVEIRRFIVRIFRRLINPLDGFGYLSNVILYLSVVFVVVVEQLLLRKCRPSVEHLKLKINQLRIVKGRIKDAVEIPFHVIGYLTSNLLRRGLIHGGYAEESINAAHREQLAIIAQRLADLKKILELSE